MYVWRSSNAGGVRRWEEKSGPAMVNIKSEARPVFLWLTEATPLSTEVRRRLSNVNPPSWPLWPGYHRHQGMERAPCTGTSQPTHLVPPSQTRRGPGRPGLPLPALLSNGVCSHTAGITIVNAAPSQRQQCAVQCCQCTHASTGAPNSTVRRAAGDVPEHRPRRNARPA